MKLDPTDRKMLVELLAASQKWEDDHDGDLDPRFRVSVFRGWLEADVALSVKRRQWLRDTHEKVTGTPNYVNMASSGKLARGREVASMVGPLPLKPPGRA